MDVVVAGGAGKIGLRLLRLLHQNGHRGRGLIRKEEQAAALRSAWTAVMYQRPSKAFEDAVAGGRHVVMTLPGVTTVEGGLPVVVDGHYVGAIGVSGAKSPEDSQVAQAGLDALKA